MASLTTGEAASSNWQVVLIDHRVGHKRVGSRRRVPAHRAFLLTAPLVISGCAQHSAPSLSLFGAFFPAWMLCALIGVAGARLDAYRNGVGSITDLALAETQLLQARNAASIAYSAALSSAATLALATGALGQSP